MQYLENYFDKRLDPRLLVDGAKSVISLSYNYFPEEVQNQDSYKVAKYAYGQDYHHIIKSKLKSSYIDHGRPTKIKKLKSNPNFYCTFSGKINSIYEIEKELLNV